MAPQCSPSSPRRLKHRGWCFPKLPLRCGYHVRRLPFVEAVQGCRNGLGALSFISISPREP